MKKSDLISRRSFLQAAVVAPQLIGAHGKINPSVPVPDIELLMCNGVRTRLLHLIEGRATAVHLMFTACSTTCPIEAATFRKVQESMAGMEKNGIQLLSLTMDPEDDTPATLRAWLRHYHAGPAWVAAAPAPRDLPKVQAFFGKGNDSLDHSTQVHILNRSGSLAWRTAEFPTPGEIAAILRRVASQE